MNLDGIDILGPMPEPVQIVTTFTAGQCAASTHTEAVAVLLDFMRSPAADEAKRRHGMAPA
jgi:molybdate transport system substrate-binding protein